MESDSLDLVAALATKQKPVPGLQRLLTEWSLGVVSAGALTRRECGYQLG
jgi:hypothetical protein